MMPTTRPEDLDTAFDDHPSLAASLEDFEEQERRSPLFGLPSQHSGFRSDRDGSEMDDRSSNGAPWSPPGFRARTSNASSWFRHEPYSRLHLQPSNSPSRSRQTSPEYQDAEEGDPDITLAMNTPLPAGADSPWKDRSPEPEFIHSNIPRGFDGEKTNEENSNNYIRFAMRAEVQHREPFVPLMNFVHRKVDSITKTRSSTIFAILVSIMSILLARVILAPAVPPPVPDLVKLTALAKSFEPLIVYSENGHNQIVALQETSVAVWDLGESVRNTNMTSAPLIVKELDNLSDTLRALGLELTRFFADVDGDVDGILIVMDWARRELAGVDTGADSSIAGRLFDHFHGLLNRVGLLETSTGPTQLGSALTTVFGATSPQRTRATLTRTFYEFLSVLEESINTELTHSATLFTIFEAIDRQFLNLQRLTIREADNQDRLEETMLSSMWTRIMGSNAATLRKYEKNKQLLSSVRERTVSNKYLIIQHHTQLQTLKVMLEALRKKLVSPLVRRNDSVSIDNASVIEQQIKGLDGAYDFLSYRRTEQKTKLMDMVYGAGRIKTRIIPGVDATPNEQRY